METKEMTPHRLPVARTLACACVLVLAGLSAAGAQFLPGPGQSMPPAQFPLPPGASNSAFPPPPGQSRSQPRQDSAFPPPPGQSRPRAGQASAFPPPGGQSICATFPGIRSEVEKSVQAIQAAGKRKATREQVCPLFKSFAIREARMVKFLVTNQRTCGVPPQAIKAAKANHAKTLQIRNQVCSAAPAPAGPTLSDALGGPIIADDTSAKQPGRGTFDTLTGNALAR
jgi:hypothetical protein